MDWLDEAAEKHKRKNQLFFSKDSALLRDLAQLLREQSHRTVVLWALELAEESAAAFGAKYPGERRPQEAVEAARAWAAGTIRMRLAQRKILDCHGVAKELSCQEDIALCHAVGQACSVVHTAGHALGYPIYDLTALLWRLGIENCREAVEARNQLYLDRLCYWQTHLSDYQGGWADFIPR